MLRICTSLVALPLSLCLQAETLGVYLDKPLPAPAAASLREELRNLMKETGIGVELRQMKERKAGESFERLMVVQLKGNCAAMEGGGAMRGGPLASTQVEGGRILPYTEVFCDRLEQVLAAGWGSAPLYRRHVLTGRAMARVLAHEIYHFLAQEKGHAGSGVAKNCFHHRDLLGEEFAFDDHTVGRMRGRAEQGESGEEEPAGRE